MVRGENRAHRQVKRLFALAVVVEAAGVCTARGAASLYRRKSGLTVSDKQIRRDLILLAELGVLNEARDKKKPTARLLYAFRGWPAAI